MAVNRFVDYLLEGYDHMVEERLWHLLGLPFVFY